jgi:hypothetical protein
LFKTIRARTFKTPGLRNCETEEEQEIFGNPVVICRLGDRLPPNHRLAASFSFAPRRRRRATRSRRSAAIRSTSRTNVSRISVVTRQGLNIRCDKETASQGSQVWWSPSSSPRWLPAQATKCAAASPLAAPSPRHPHPQAKTALGSAPRSSPGHGSPAGQAADRSLSQEIAPRLDPSIPSLGPTMCAP